jgi:hypothetical protein
MRATTLSESPAGVPFTWEEYLRAQLQVRPRDHAEVMARRLFDTPGMIGAHLMDGDLLLLALLSEDLAERVVTFRPALRRPVEESRQDPAATVEMWKAALRDSPPP